MFSAFTACLWLPGFSYRSTQHPVGYLISRASRQRLPDQKKRALNPQLLTGCRRINGCPLLQVCVHGVCAFGGVKCRAQILSMGHHTWSYVTWVICAAAPGEQLGVRCPNQGHLSRGIEGGESAVHSLPPPTTHAGQRLELAIFRLQIQLSNH